ncbi:MAG: DnaJ domain-containing protein [Kofleriaceae bacterium]
MDLAGAYRVLEIAPGASKDEAREAKIVLAKVWHPDRHQGDPKVHDRADRKLREINEAYTFLETAGFPKVELPQREAPPAYVDSLTPRPHATPPKTEIVHDAPPPRRRVRSWIPFALGAVVAAGAIAFVLQHDKHAATIAPPPPIPTATPPIPANTAGFTIGSSRDDVRKIMGEPTRIDQTFGERWSYGMAEVTFKHGVVYGWRSSAFDQLKVWLAPTDPTVAAAARARGSYGPHASRDEVLGVEGAPDGIDDTFGETWTFGMSHLTFDQDGHIHEVWNTQARPLHLAK